MQIAAVTRRTIRVLNPRAAILYFIAENPHSHPSPSFPHSRNFHHFTSPGKNCGISGISFSDDLWFSKSHTASFCSVPVAADVDVVKELHDKIIESIKVKRSAPPNAWLWSMIEKCKGPDDIKFLFAALQQLRIFRLSNLRIHDNFNSNLCQEVTKACIRSSALDFGKKALWKHNVYGLTPTVASANQLLSYAKEQKDVELMKDIMSHIKKNDLPLQPATADIVLSICYNADNWELISKYAKRFSKAGVKLRKTTFDIWLGFASRRGDLESLWKIEKLRSELYNKHTIRSGFSCCKNFPDSKQEDILAELNKLVSEWPAEVIKSQKQEDQKALITALKADIPAMINSLSSMGIDSRVNLDDLNIV
ncbi:hypothetical protein KSS87_011535 [Heliosperma pusillum]|nr:hypothetical protein KSS87_011535 [Heliosperma pusillum]